MDSNLTKHYVDSSNISWVGYDEKKKDLFVAFKNNSEYVYHKVPKKVFLELLDAGSKGRYHAMKIKYSYNYEKL